MVNRPAHHLTFVSCVIRRADRGEYEVTVATYDDRFYFSTAGADAPDQFPFQY